MTTPSASLDIPAYSRNLATRARQAAAGLAASSGAQRAAAISAVADRLAQQSELIQQANIKDLASGRAAGLPSAFLDKLALDAKRIDAIVDSVRQIARQPDPLGQVIEGYHRPNGLELQKVRVPIGVILMIYESRPNVTSDAAALCIKSGNAVILRSGKEALHSSLAIAQCVQQGLQDAGLDPQAVQLVDTPDRQVVTELLHLEGLIDLCIPRGGESLIRTVVKEARIPVIKHYTGNCHVYVDESADPDMALNICVNAKTQRPGVCNAAESLLFHQAAAQSGTLKKVCEALTAQGVEIRGDSDTTRLLAHAKVATEQDWFAEYLDLIVAVRVVKGLDQAIEHINHYGSHHTDAIVTQNLDAARRFVQLVDSANVMVNASTRFSDGGEYGLGAEIGISTDRLHARGPMGAADLTTYKWVVYGQGHIRQ